MRPIRQWRADALEKAVSFPNSPKALPDLEPHFNRHGSGFAIAKMLLPKLFRRKVSDEYHRPVADHQRNHRELAGISGSLLLHQRKERGNEVEYQLMNAIVSPDVISSRFHGFNRPLDYRSSLQPGFGCSRALILAIQHAR